MADDIDMEKPAEKVTVNNDCVMKSEKMFSLKRWNAVAMWSWDVECEICAICRVQVMDACLRCQAENRNDKEQEECVVIWGECNHSFHNCCMKLWVTSIF
uniref:RING-box protein n=1 Tax=Daphnia magna TaxID=35525 RepID=A0A0P5B3F7_9CRUS